jgi:AAA domain
MATKRTCRCPGWSDGLLPETGAGLVSGQWGTFKSFTLIDLAAAIMAGVAFIDFPIVRRGGVLFIAAEGANLIRSRLKAVLKAKHAGIGRVPFAWTDHCPRLLDAGALAVLTAPAHEAHEQMMKEFRLPLVLIVIDTLGVAAGYAKAGDENDAAVNQAIMNKLSALSRATGAWWQRRRPGFRRGRVGQVAAAVAPGAHEPAGVRRG